MPKRKIGTIEKLGEGRYFVKVQRGRRQDGKPRIASETVYGTLDDAEIACARLAASLGRSIGTGLGITLSQYYWGMFRDSPSNRGEKRSQATLDQYDGEFRRNIEPALGTMEIDSIGHSDLKACVINASAPSRCKTVLRAIMRSAYNDGLVDEKPFDRRIVTPRPKKEQQAPWDAVEAARALEAFRGYRDPMMEAYVILGLSGFRCEEVLGVSPTDCKVQQVYDIATGDISQSVTVSITHTYTDADGYKAKAKNQFSLRTMPVIERGRDRLLSIIEQSRPSDPDLVPDWLEGRLIDLNYSQLRIRWNKACAELEIRRIPPDMLRHTSETLMQRAGLPDTLVSRMHGHTELQTDYRHYMRPDVAAAESAAQAVERALPSRERLSELSSEMNKLRS